MKVIILGGVAAGTKVAAKLKRELPDAQVHIYTKGEDISYAGCGLPYYLSGVIKKPEDLIVNTPEKFSGLTQAEVTTETEAIAMDPAAKTVTLKNIADGKEFTESYDKLVIATGADSVKPPIPGIDLEGVYYLRTPKDAITLREDIKAKGFKRVVVVGGGFIGLEAAENLNDMGIRTTVIDMAPQVLPGFDPEVAGYIERHLGDQGIPVFTSTKLEAIEGDGKVEKVQTDRRGMKCDAVIMAVGIRANTAFTKDTGLELMPNRTIKINNKMETNLKDVYALGDCASVTNEITDATAWAPMGSQANMEGRLLARSMAGKEVSHRGVLGTMVIKLPELNAAKTGLSETQAKEQNLDVATATCVVDDKAHYYPGASTFIIKLIADKSTMKLLGLQVLGKGSVDKIVDIAVTAISLDASLPQLEDMDLAYAPPFSTAIHPFTHAVNVLMNKISGDLDSLTPTEYEGAEEDYHLIDAAIQPSLDGAQYVNLVEVDENTDLPKDKPLLLVCQKGKRAYLLQNRLKRYGYKTKVLEGGSTFSEIDQ